MQLICPKCKANLPHTQVNLAQGVCYCQNCKEYFRLADHLRTDEEIRRIQKPYYSKVTIDNDGMGNYDIFIPCGGWSGTVVFFLIFAVGFGMPVVLNFSGTVSGGNFFSLFLTVPISSFFLLLALFHLRSSIRVLYNAQRISVSRNLFGLKWEKSRTAGQLEKITEDVIYTKNYNPVYGVGLYFKGESKIKFGSFLKEDERKWLIGELYEIKTKLMSRRSGYGNP